MGNYIHIQAQTSENSSNRLFLKLASECSFPSDKSVWEIPCLEDFELEPAFKRLTESERLKDIYLMKLDASCDASRILHLLNQRDYVDYAELVPENRLFYDPNDPSFATQWALQKVKAPAAWDLETGCNEVILAIVDDAFLLSHEDLAGIFVPGYDVADGDSDPNPPVALASNQSFSHGTHCAGIAAASTDNGTGISGMGFNLKVMPIKATLDSETGPAVTHAYDGVEYAIDQEVDVISLSWGGSGYSQTYQALFNDAFDAGITVVAAAGNDDTNIAMYPASYDNVISVGASDANDLKASFSNYGSTIDVMAPGVDILSTVAGSGGSSNSYEIYQGTSMACPLVAGLCGLMKCFSPNIDPTTIEGCLKSTAENIDQQNPTYIGDLGAGRVNAYQALLCLQSEPLALFEADFETACPGQSIQLNDLSAGIEVDEWLWEFPGGNPSTSTEQNPTVNYNSVGIYDITFTATNAYGSNSKIQSIEIVTPSAELLGSTSILSGNSTAVYVVFQGAPPFSFVYSDGTSEINVDNISSNPYYFSVSPDQDTNYELIAYSDAYCEGLGMGAAEVLLNQPGDVLDCTYSTLYGNDEDNILQTLIHDPVTNAIYGMGRNPHFSVYNASGDLVAAKSHTGGADAINYSVLAPNGDIIASSSSVDGSLEYYLQRISPSGEVLWANVYDLPGHRYPRICKSLGDTYYMMGWCSGVAGDDACLLYIDGDGEVIWSKKVSYPEDLQSRGIVSDGLGGCVFTGETTATGSKVDVCLANIDASGNLVWGYEYSGIGINPHDRAYSLNAMKDGGYLIYGVNWQQGGGAPDGKDGFALRIGPDQSINWLVKFDTGAGDSHFFSRGVEDDNGDIFLSGGTPSQPVLVKLDAQGNLMWQKGMDNCDGIMDLIIPENDPGKIIVGSRLNLGTGFGGTDYSITRWDTDFNTCIADPAALTIKTETFVAETWTPTVQDIITNKLTKNVTVTDYLMAKNELCGSCCEVEANFVASDTTICVGSSIEFINLSSLASEYKWKLDGIEFSTDQNTAITFPDVGVFQLELLAINETCDDQVEFQVVVVEEPSVVLDQAHSICIGESVFLNASGGAEYLWTPQEGLSDPNIANPEASPVTDTEYTVEVIGANGCISYAAVEVIVGSSDAILDFSLGDAYCPGDLVSIIDNNQTMGATPEWTFEGGIPASFAGANPPPVQFNGTGAMQITVTVEDPLCGSRELTKSANIFPHPLAEAGNDTLICLLNNTTVSIELGAIPVSNFEYHWTPAADFDDANISNPILLLDPTSGSQVYWLNVSNPVSGCSSVDSIFVEVNQSMEGATDSLTICEGSSLELPNGEVVSMPGIYEESYTASNGCDSLQRWLVAASDDFEIESEEEYYVIEMGNSVELSVVSDEDKLSFEWVTEGSLSCQDCPAAIVTPTETTSYLVSAFNELGCEKQLEITVEVESGNFIILPSAFSPNGDSVNDDFTVLGKNIDRISLSVYNRWGQLAGFSDSSTGWDGIVGSEPAPVGVYIYHVEVQYLDGSSDRKVGNVSLIR